MRAHRRGIVSPLGALIEAPVCSGAYIDISAFAGFEYVPGKTLSGELVYGTADIPGAKASALLLHRTIGDNRQRLAREYLLYQWCLGGDDQWLYDPDRRIYGHDHGRWLLDTQSRFIGAPVWSATTLEPMLSANWHSFQYERAVDRAELAQAAQRLGAVTHDDLLLVLEQVVDAWAGCDVVFADGLNLADTMRRVGDWLERRRDVLVDGLCS